MCRVELSLACTWRALGLAALMSAGRVSGCATLCVYLLIIGLCGPYHVLAVHWVVWPLMRAVHGCAALDVRYLYFEWSDRESRLLWVSYLPVRACIRGGYCRRYGKIL